MPEIPAAVAAREREAERNDRDERDCTGAATQKACDAGDVLSAHHARPHLTQNGPCQLTRGPQSSSLRGS